MEKILGVAACPAGIAHTYIVAESLEQAGKRAGYEVKVETSGASGVENDLTEEEIDEAVAIIIAADTKVEMERFRGKPLIDISLKDAIRKPDEIIEEIKNNKLEIY